MKKLLLALVMVVAMAVPSFAAALSVDNLVVGAEYSYAKKDIEDINLVNISLGKFNAGLTERTSNVRLWQFAATVGYEINDALIPYALIGDGMLNFDQELIIHVGDFSTPILMSEFRKSHGLMFGAGAKGELLKFDNGITIVYDTRWITFNSESDEDGMQIVPGYTDISLDNETEISYGEFTIDTGVTKLFDLRKVTKLEDGTEQIEKPLAVEGIAPYLGIRYSHVDMVVRDSFSAGDYINAGTEIETQGGMISGVLGLNVKVNKDWCVGINGILGQEAGVNVRVGFSF